MTEDTHRFKAVVPAKRIRSLVKRLMNICGGDRSLNEQFTELNNYHLI